MSTYYYSWREPIGSVQVDKAEEHTVVRLYDTHPALLGELCFRNNRVVPPYDEDPARVFLSNLKNHDPVAQTQGIGNRQVRTVQLKEFTTPTVIDDYGEIVRVENMKEWPSFVPFINQPKIPYKSNYTDPNHKD